MSKKSSEDMSPGLNSSKYKPKVLIIEDNETELEVLHETITSMGYSSRKACDAEQALIYVISERFDIALIDINLPGKNGLELLQIFSKKYKHMKNIIITGHSSLETAKKAVLYGANGYLPKPYDIDELEGLMNKCIRKKTGHSKNKINDKAMMNKFYKPI